MSRLRLTRLGPVGEAIRRHERLHGFARAPVQVGRNYLYFRARNIRGRTRRGDAPVVCFAPESPHSRYVMWKVCQLLGARLTSRVNRDCDIRYAWVDDSAAVGDEPADVSQDSINGLCVDIGKRAVDEAQGAVFGYRLAVDPTTHLGPCVEKSDRNAAHDGRIVECPLADPDPKRVYQRVIRNERDDGTVEDIRAAIVAEEIPFVYIKHRPVSDRFSVLNSHVHIAETDSWLSPAEQDRLRQVSSRLGLDVGEIDVLRDRGDGRIYVVDVNRTCYGPPFQLSFGEERLAVERLGEAFERAFL